MSKYLAVVHTVWPQQQRGKRQKIKKITLPHTKLRSLKDFNPIHISKISDTI